MKLNNEYLDQFDNLKPLLELALKDLETHYELFVRAVNTEDTKLLIRTSHTLKGLAGYLENLYLTQSLAMLHQALKDNSPIVAKTQIVMVNKLLPRLIDCVHERLSTLK